MNKESRRRVYFPKISRTLRSQVAWGYCVLLIYLLITPSPLAPFGGWGQGTEEVIDRTLSSYLQHVVAYALLVMIFCWRSAPLSFRDSLFWAGAASLHGTVFEGFQYFVPSRECDWQDWLSNLTGVTLGLFVVQLLHYFGRDLAEDFSPESERTQIAPNSIS